MIYNQRKSRTLFRLLDHGFRAVSLVLLAYLLQTCVVPLIAITNTKPNLLMVFVAIFTVSYGKKYAFISGATFGIMMEAMSYSVSLFYVVLYPALAYFCSFIFADMTDAQRYKRQSHLANRNTNAATKSTNNSYGKAIHFYGNRKKSLFSQFLRGDDEAGDIKPHIRIVLNALLLTGLYELIVFIYLALNGIQINFYHIGRFFGVIFYTFLSCVLMYPARRWLKISKSRRKEEIENDISQKEIETPYGKLKSLEIQTDSKFEENAESTGVMQRFFQKWQQSRSENKPKNQSDADSEPDHGENKDPETQSLLPKEGNELDPKNTEARETDDQTQQFERILSKTDLDKEAENKGDEQQG